MQLGSGLLSIFKAIFAFTWITLSSIKYLIFINISIIYIPLNTQWANENSIFYSCMIPMQTCLVFEQMINYCVLLKIRNESDIETQDQREIQCWYNLDISSGKSANTPNKGVKSF